MNCDRALTLISRLLDNELSLDERDQVDGHVHECEVCFALLLKLKEDSARLDEAFAGLKGTREAFTARTAAIIAERERPHTANSTSPGRADERSHVRRLWITAGASAAASAAAFLLMAGTMSNDTSRKTDPRIVVRTEPLPTTRLDEIDLVLGEPDADAKSLTPVRPIQEREYSSSQGHSISEVVAVSPNGGGAVDVDDAIQGKIDRLIAAVLSADPAADAMRSEILSLGTVSQRVIDALKARLDSETDLLVKETLLRILTGLHSPDGTLGEFLALRFQYEETTPIKRLLLQGLLGNSYPGAVELFETILLQDAEDHHVKVLAVQALGGLGSDEALDVLISIALRDESDAVRLETVRVLSQFSDASLIDEYIAILRSQTETFDVQEEALKAVSKTASDRDAALDALDQAIQMMPRPEIRARAKAIVGKLFGDRQEVR